MKEGTTTSEASVALGVPPWRHNHENKPRRVGIEIEMIGLELERIAAIVANYLGASIESRGRYERILRGDPDGEWLVELDFMLLRKLGREEHAPEELLSDLKSSAEGVLKWLAEPLVPLEVITPPLPMTRLADVERLVVMLREAGARGTSDKMSYAFGMQLNVEIPSADAATLTCYVKAFACLYDWLQKRAEINLTRRFTSYVDPYPFEYVRMVIEPAYRPSLATLIEDYLHYNPTRNRALDLLPLMLYLDEPRVRAVTQDPLIKPRPAFHYRLPDSDIHRPEWNIGPAWSDWLEVELLAADPERLERCCRAYQEFLESPVQRWLGGWADEVAARWLREAPR